MNSLTNPAVAILERLVSFNTVSDYSNLECIGYIREYLASLGVASTIISDETGLKASLFATIGDPSVPGVVLSGHTDVVPVLGQVWQRDPFRLKREESRLYGRGTTDMKGYLACMLAIVPYLLAKPRKYPVHFSFSYDEEWGCKGIHGLISHMKAAVALPMAAFIGEPTCMAVVDAHKGSKALDTAISSLSCHSSRPDLGVSAISAAMRIAQMLEDLAAELAAAPTPELRYDLPYSTINIGRISGGTARNLVPGDCALQWEVRGTVPAITEAVQRRFDDFIATQLLPEMQSKYPDCRIETSVFYDVPALVANPGSTAETMAKSFARANDTLAVNYGTEAGIFSLSGIPSVVCGPGDITQAHIPDEWIAVDQISRCMAFMQEVDRASAY